MVGVDVAVAVAVGDGVIVGVKVRVGVGVSVAKREICGLFSPVNTTTRIIIPVITSKATSTQTITGPRCCRFLYALIVLLAEPEFIVIVFSFPALELRGESFIMVSIASSIFPHIAVVLPFYLNLGL